MLKEVKILRQDIRRTWDGSLIKISKKGQPDKYQNTDRYLIDLVDKAVRAVREDCAKVADGFSNVYLSLENKTEAKGKSPEIIDVARRFACDEIAAAIRGKK